MSEMLATLGVTKEELLDLAAKKLATELIGDGDAFDELVNRLERMKQEAVEAAVTRIFTEKFDAIADQMVSGLVMQEVTKWGEKKGVPMSLHEYIEHRATEFMVEKVDFDGHPQGSKYDWKPYGTRIAAAIDRYMLITIRMAMEKILQTANTQLVSGIKGAVEVQLTAILKGLQVSATVKS